MRFFAFAIFLGIGLGWDELNWQMVFVFGVAGMFMLALDWRG